MQFDNKIRMKIIIADRVMVIIKVCHTFHNPLKWLTLYFMQRPSFRGIYQGEWVKQKGETGPGKGLTSLKKASYVAPAGVMQLLHK